MEKESNNDMKRIQKGLEEFLEEEIPGYRASEEKYQSRQGREYRSSADTGVKLDLLGREPEENVRSGVYGQEPAAGVSSGAHGQGSAKGVKLDLLGQDTEARPPRSYYERRAEAEDGSAEDFYEEESEESQERYEDDVREPVKQKRSVGRTESVRQTGSVGRAENGRQTGSDGHTGGGRQMGSSRQAGNSGHEGSGRKASGQAARGKKDSQAGGRDLPKKKPRKKKRFWKVLLVCLLGVCILVFFLWNRLVNSIYEKMNYNPIAGLENEKMEENGVTNILLIGNDSRTQGEDGRSDAMILLSISNGTKAVHMTSLLRDMYVEIPGHGHNRLNAAYSYGGAQLLMETLELNFDLHVNRYVQVNFQAFANLVDAVGGVDLELTNDEVIYVNGYLVEYNILEGRPEGTDYLDDTLSGMIHLNGPQALAYCRNRYIGTDFARTERQRKVLSAIIQKAPSALLTNAGELMDGLLPNLTTNLSQEECRNLSLQASKLLTYDIVQNSIPIEGSYSPVTIDKMAVLEVDFEQNKAYIRENIYGEGQ